MTTLRRNRHKTTRRVSGTLNATMSLAYLGCGIALFVVPVAESVVPSDFRVPVAWALLLYGIFRAYRAYIQLTDQS